MGAGQMWRLYLAHGLQFGDHWFKQLFGSLAGLPCPVAGKEAWNYVKVRDGAHMFWWLYYADSQSAEFMDLPLVMWLQVGHHLQWHIWLQVSHQNLVALLSQY